MLILFPVKQKYSDRMQVLWNVAYCVSGNGGLGIMIEPIFEFAMGLAKLQLDHTEVALLAAVLLMQSGEHFSQLCALKIGY